MATRKASKKGAGKKATVRQRKFVEGVVQHGNVTKAARDAGYKHPNKQGHQNLVKLGISEAVERRKAEALSRAGITTDEIVGSIAEIATASLADVDSNDEFLRKAKEGGVDHLIKKVKVIYDKQGNVTSREYEMYSRLEALDKLLDVRGAKKQAASNPRDVAKQALIDMRARFPDLSEETARQIISETFSVQESELVN